MDDKMLQTLREQLVKLRDEIQERRRSANRSWLALSDPETELEETASKNLLSRALEQIEERTRSQERLIDDALAKMEQGEYGECKECARPISLKRLKLVPWARHCVRCAGSLELAHTVRASAEAVSASMERGEPLDEEMCAIVASELKDDGRVELDELEIHCAEGVVYLEGALPGEQSRELLRQVVSDTLGYDRMVDHIRIDRQAWENRRRSPVRSADRRPEKEV
jgi:DnaK suppressor protein